MYMKRRLTLALDAEIFRRIREIALKRGISVSQLIRGHLSQLVQEIDWQQRALERIREIFKTSFAKAGPVTWTRDELYARPTNKQSSL